MTKSVLMSNLQSFADFLTICKTVIKELDLDTYSKINNGYKAFSFDCSIGELLIDNFSKVINDSQLNSKLMQITAVQFFCKPNNTLGKKQIQCINISTNYPDPNVIIRIRELLKAVNKNKNSQFSNQSIDSSVFSFYSMTNLKCLSKVALQLARDIQLVVNKPEIDSEFKSMISIFKSNIVKMTKKNTNNNIIVLLIETLDKFLNLLKKIFSENFDVNDFLKIKDMSVFLLNFNIFLQSVIDVYNIIFLSNDYFCFDDNLIIMYMKKKYYIYKENETFESIPEPDIKSDVLVYEYKIFLKYIVYLYILLYF